MLIFMILTLLAQTQNTAYNTVESTGFAAPTLTDILTFVIRIFFVAAGTAAVIMLLLGALSWITSGGNKENVQKARDKILAALVGLILVVVVISAMTMIEQQVFGGKLCFGISCPIGVPSLIPR